MLDSLQSLMPLIVVSAAAVAVLLLSAFKRSTVLSFLTAAGGLIWAAVLINQWTGMVSLFNNSFRTDEFGRIGGLACILAGLFAILPAWGYLKRAGIEHRDEYFALILFAVAGMIVMIAANDLMVMFVNLEVMSISTYVLCGMNRGSAKSTESALKYFVNGAVASAILLFGIAIMFGVFGATNLDTIASKAGAIRQSGSFLLPLFGGSCILVGFLFKMGIVPFHAWVPDVYQGAPTLVTGFMAAGVRIAAGIVLIRLFADVFAPLAPGWDRILWWAAVVTMTLGNFSALVQNNVKRMLGYSSIAHAGYVLVAFVGMRAAGEGSAAAVYYLIAYSVASLGMFIMISRIEGENETNLDYDDYKGLGLRNPWGGIALSVFLLSLTGIPPFAGFFGKYAVFSVAVKNGFVGLAVIGVLNSLVSAYFYFRLMVNMYMSKSEASIPATVSPGFLAGVTVLCCAFLTLWFGMGPMSVFGMVPSLDELLGAINGGVEILQRRF